MDGLPPGSWLGQERPMSRPVKQHDAAGEKEEEKKNPQYQRLHAAIMIKKTILN